MVAADEALQGGQLGIFSDIPVAAELNHFGQSVDVLSQLPRQVVAEERSPQPFEAPSVRSRKQIVGFASALGIRPARIIRVHGAVRIGVIVQAQGDVIGIAVFVLSVAIENMGIQ